MHWEHIPSQWHLWNSGPKCLTSIYKKFLFQNKKSKRKVSSPQGVARRINWGNAGKNFTFQLLLVLDANEEIPGFQLQKEFFFVINCLEFQENISGHVWILQNQAAFPSPSWLERTECREKTSGVNPKLGCIPLLRNSELSSRPPQDESQFPGSQEAPAEGWLLTR